MKVTTVLLFALISIFSIHAQEEQSIKEKLENITGKIKNITIETEKGDFQFKGEEVEK